MMLSDKNVIINLALDHIEGEGDWQLCTADGCNVGDDID